MIELTVTVSDTDVLVKLAKAGYLELLRGVFKSVVIPQMVYSEFQRKVGRQGRGISLDDAQKQGWLQVIDPNKDFSTDQRQSFKIFVQSNEYYLDPGELHAAGLANELGINCILSDDRDAKRLIKNILPIEGIAYWEIIYLHHKINGTDLDYLEAIFDEINSVVDNPIKRPFRVIMDKCAQRFDGLLREQLN